MSNLPTGDRRLDRGVSRRRYLAGVATTVGAGIASGLAGCVGLRGSGYDRPQAGFDPTSLPYDRTYPDDETVTMFRGGTRRLGYYPNAVVPDSVNVNWQFPVNYVGHSAAKASPRPAPNGETIVIPADTGQVHAVTPEGRHRWIRQTGATRQGIHATPAIADGVAYVGGYGGDMYAFDVERGDTRWRTRRARLDWADAIGASPAYWDGVIYVVVEYGDPPSGALYAIDAETGDPLFSDDRIKGMPHPSPTIDPAHERLVGGSNDGRVYCWVFPSLEFEWSFETGGEIKGTIVAYDGSAFVGSWDGNVYRLDLDDGTEEWSFETGNVVMSNPGVDPEAGVVYVGSDDWHVYALDADSGEAIWSRDVGGNVIGSVTVTADAVLVGSYDTHLYALEKETGEVRWRVRNRGHVTSEPVPHDGRIYYTERAHITGHWDETEPEVLHAPGHAYCLVDASSNGS